MNQLKICICDSVKEDYEWLQSTIKSVMHDKDYLIQIYDDGNNFLQIDCYQFDLIFLEICMKNCNGIEVAQAMRKNGYKNDIIFYTSSKEFILEGYKVHAFDYLMKPTTAHEIEEVLQKYIDLRIKNEKILTILDSHKNPKYNIPLSKIEYIESTNTWVTIYLNDGHHIRMYTKLSDLEETIHDSRFLRCHQSYLVNMDYILQATDVFELISGQKVPIRVRKRKQIQDTYLQYIYNKKNE